MLQEDNTSRQLEMQPETQQPNNTFQQFHVQSSMEVLKNSSQQSQKQPETTCIAELEAKNASLQAELDLLKSKSLYELTFENQLLKVELGNAKECIQILLDQVEEKDQQNSILTEEEKEIDRKGKKVAAKGKTVICFTKKGTNEVISAMPVSDSDDSDEEGGGEMDDEDEDDHLQLKTLMKMKMLGGVVGSSSKMGSSSKTDCVLSNGEAEKSVVLDENNQWLSKPLGSESDLIPKYLKSNQSTSWLDKMIYEPNYKEVLKLAGSSETGSSSCQTGLPPDEMKSKSTTGTPEMKESVEGEAELTPRKRKWGVYWGSEEDMLCSLTCKPEMLLEAVCALFRFERTRRFSRFKRMPYRGLSDSDYQRLLYVASLLTQGDMDGPCKKTTEEIEMYLKGSIDFCGQLVGSYSDLLFQIYSRGWDLHFC